MKSKATNSKSARASAPATHIKANLRLQLPSLADALILGAFFVLMLGLTSCRSTDHDKWEKQIREGAKLMLEPRDYKDSEAHLDQAFKIARRIGGLEGEQLESLTLPALWTAKMRLEKFAEAESLLVRNIELDRRLHGPDNRDLAYPIGSLARLFLDQKRYKEAQPLFIESLRIEQLNNSPKSFSIADLQLGFGEVEAALGDSLNADSLFRQALSIYRTARHPDSRHRKALETYHKFLLNRGRLAESSYIKAEIDSVTRNIETLKRNRNRDTTGIIDS